MVSRYVDVEVDLDEFSDDDLIDELADRGHRIRDKDIKEFYELVSIIFEKRRNKKDFNQDLDDLIYTVIGRISS